MYALIKGSGNFIGIFSSKKKMKIVIEALIKDNKEKEGTPCDFNFKYVKVNIDEPWFVLEGKTSTSPEANAILSLYTMHPEKFTHKVKTDWSTGKIIDMDANSTNNLDDK